MLYSDSHGKGPRFEGDAGLVEVAQESSRAVAGGQYYRFATHPLASIDGYSGDAAAAHCEPNNGGIEVELRPVLLEEAAETIDQCGELIGADVGVALDHEAGVVAEVGEE
jgi:hypothetical protein